MKMRIYKKRKSRFEKLSALQVKRAPNENPEMCDPDPDGCYYPDAAFWHALRLYREANTWHYNKYRRNPACPPL